ncbi:hypothetical protein RN001_002190 [Aquatica leii]|uniref:Uncharacterized protein n=1 Tax=Aquatica leii TaxID=1421715 RepID=A0AAN7Q4Y9_9COLE|nr:hypothetical protein RN001_002190 [Aquatica leii]
MYFVKILYSSNKRNYCEYYKMGQKECITEIPATGLITETVSVCSNIKSGCRKYIDDVYDKGTNSKLIHTESIPDCSADLNI